MTEEQLKTLLKSLVITVDETQIPSKWSLHLSDKSADYIMNLIKQYVSELIGEDEIDTFSTGIGDYQEMYTVGRNKFRDELREKAGLKLPEGEKV